ncbi:MAG: RDD family protein [Deltaproteobacteria bacterium]
MQCPRCRTENGEAAIRCSGCGAPIALGDEVVGVMGDTSVPLDRRNSPRERPPPAWESLRPVPVDWEMEPPVEPTPAASRIPSRGQPRPRPRAAIPAPADLEFDMAVEAVEVHRVRAPGWRRIASWAVDGALLGAASAAMLLPVLGPVLGPGGLEQARGVLAPTLLAIALLAFAYQWLGITLTGATPGMGAAGLRCVGPDGRRPSPGRSAIRSAAALVSAAALGIGVLLALFTRSGRGAHDLVAGTWVVLAAPAGRAG